MIDIYTGPDDGILLESLLPIETDELETLHEKLGLAADRDGSLDIAYRMIDTAVGELLIAATPKGIVRVAFAREGFDSVLESLAQKVSPRVLHSARRLDQAARELDEYFAGKRREFDLPLDYALSSGFRRTVQHHLPEIAYGHTESYKEVAEAVGNPKAVRAVGTACATNPLPVIVPCHRVLRTDGSMGGYLGGLEAKTILLELERAA